MKAYRHQKVTQETLYCMTKREKSICVLIVVVSLLQVRNKQKGCHQAQSPTSPANHYKLIQAVLNRIIAEYETYTAN